MTIPGRAETDEQKRAVLDRIFEAWKRKPEQRLGQFLDNVIAMEAPSSMFQIEDDTLVRCVELFAGYR